MDGRGLFLAAYCTSHTTLKISQIRPFVENEESFRKFCHGGTTWNSILRGTIVTDFRFFFFKKQKKSPRTFSRRSGYEEICMHTAGTIRGIIIY